MPSVPGVFKGPVKSTLTVPNVSDTEVASPTLVPEPPAEPEPAITPEQWVAPTQDELAARGLATQNVGKRNTMTPAFEEPVDPATSAERKAKAKSAIEARWAKRYDWVNSPLDESLAYLAELRAEVEKGGLAVQGRIDTLKVEKVKCFGCTNIINLSEGRYAGMRARNNFETNVTETAYACSAACYLKLQRDFIHPVAIRTLEK